MYNYLARSWVENGQSILLCPIAPQPQQPLAFPDRGFDPWPCFGFGCAGFDFVAACFSFLNSTETASALLR